MAQIESEQQTGLPVPVDELLLSDALVDAAPDAILVINERARIVFANSAAELLFSYSRAELVGSPLELLVPERQRAKHALHGAHTWLRRGRDRWVLGWS
jgi:PAS domain S-box-containing protein